MDIIKSSNVMLLKAVKERMLRPEGVEPHHEAYVRVRRGKMERIPQKGAVIKDRGTYEAKEQEAKEVLGEQYKEFMKDVNAYMSIDEKVHEMKDTIERYLKDKEESMSKIRPILTKFENLSKEEKKFLAVFKSGDFKYRFLSSQRETIPWSDVAKEAIKRLPPKLQKEMETLQETLKKVTVTEKFTMEKSNPMDQVAESLKNIVRLKEEMVRNMRTIYARSFGKSLNSAFNYVVMKSQVKGFTRTRRGKLERVNSFERMDGGKFGAGPSGDYTVKVHTQNEYKEYLEGLKNEVALEEWKDKIASPLAKPEEAKGVGFEQWARKLSLIPQFGGRKSTPEPGEEWEYSDTGVHLGVKPTEKEEDRIHVSNRLGVKPENLKYVGVQHTLDGKYLHMWNVEEPGHLKHMSTVTGIERQGKEDQFGKSMNTAFNYVILEKGRGPGRYFARGKGVEKSRVKGFTRTRKGKLERVNPFERQGSPEIKEKSYLEKQLEDVTIYRENVWNKYNEMKNNPNVSTREIEEIQYLGKKYNIQYYDLLDKVEEEKRHNAVKGIGAIGDKVSNAVNSLLRVGDYNSWGKRDTPEVEGNADDFSMDFHADRGGADGLYSPRAGVEDDDSPDFVGRGKVIQVVQNAVGAGYKVSVHDNEKGWFTVVVKRLLLSKSRTLLAGDKAPRKKVSSHELEYFNDRVQKYAKKFGVDEETAKKRLREAHERMPEDKIVKPKL